MAMVEDGGKMHKREEMMLMPLPKSFKNTKPAPEAVFQGAEAHVYRTHFLCENINLAGDAADHGLLSLSAPAALKYRPPKRYRHPILDTKITRHRILAEARVLVRLRKDGVNVPAVYSLDWDEGWLLTQWIEGRTVREVVDTHSRYITTPSSAHMREDAQKGLTRLMHQIGTAIAGMHAAGVIHGDLTTSNLLLQQDQQVNEQKDSLSLEGEVYVIDFGLASQSIQEEDRGVDLYVLERAFGTTHPETEQLWKELLDAYGRAYKGARAALKRLDEVRMRGRKKIMIG